MHVKRIKKIIGIFISVMLLSFSPVTVLAEQGTPDTPGLQFVTEEIGIEIGNEATIEIAVVNPQETNAVQIKLGFDSTSLTVIKIEEAGAMLAVNKSITPGSVTIDLAKVTGNFVNGEVVATFTVRLDNAISSDIVFDGSSMLGDDEIDPASTNSTRIISLSVPSTPEPTPKTLFNNLDDSFSALSTVVKFLLLILVGLAIFGVVLVIGRTFGEKKKKSKTAGENDS